MAKIANYCTFNYGARTGLGQIYTFLLVYTTDYILPVLQIKHLVNQDGEPTTPHKMPTGKKPLVSNLKILLFHVLYESQLHMLTQSH